MPDSATAEPQIHADQKKYIIVGLSHVNCMAQYLEKHPDPRFAVINRRNKDIESDDFPWPFENPDVLCVSPPGNEHNILSLFEQPTRFSVGRDGAGDPDRIAIPHAVFVDHMRDRMKGIGGTIRRARRRFPDSRILLLTPPPPVEDISNAQDMPASLKERMHLGVSPSVLRLAVYLAQIDVSIDYAVENDVEIILPPEAAMTPDGMLAPDYALGDLTHANVAYGKLLLEKIAAIGDRLP